MKERIPGKKYRSAVGKINRDPPSKVSSPLTSKSSVKQDFDLLQS